MFGAELEPRKYSSCAGVGGGSGGLMTCPVRTPPSSSSESESLGFARMVDPEEVDVVDSRTESRLFRTGGVGFRKRWPGGGKPGEGVDE